jgi:hypothetical protein
MELASKNGGVCPLKKIRSDQFAGVYSTVYIFFSENRCYYRVEYNSVILCYLAVRESRRWPVLSVRCTRGEYNSVILCYLALRESRRWPVLVFAATRGEYNSVILSYLAVRESRRWPVLSVRCY